MIEFVDAFKHGTRLTSSSGVREWGAAYIDASSIAFITDVSGEQQVVVRLRDGSERPLTSDREDWLMPLIVSPDGSKIAFGDKTDRLHIVDVATAKRVIVDRSEAWEITDYRFSPDSQWLAYVKPMPNDFGRIHIYSVRAERAFPISDGMHDEFAPRWDPMGQYLYFLSRTAVNPLLGDLDFQTIVTSTVRVYAIPLLQSTPPPVAHMATAVEFDLESWADGSSDELTNGLGQGDAEQPMQIDTDGLGRRGVSDSARAGQLPRS